MALKTHGIFVLRGFNLFNKCRLVVKIIPGIVTIEETAVTFEERDQVQEATRFKHKSF